MWINICFYTTFDVRCWSEVFMKTYWKTQGLGPTVIPPWLEISVAHTSYSHTNFPPTQIRLFSIVFKSLCTKWTLSRVFENGKCRCFWLCWWEQAAQLEKRAYKALDELTININTKSLEKVRQIKSELVHITRRVQRVSFHFAQECIYIVVINERGRTNG